jgi:hypothetical protein
MKGGPLRPESESESESEKQRSLWALFQAVVADNRREAMRLLGSATRARIGCARGRRDAG